MVLVLLHYELLFILYWYLLPGGDDALAKAAGKALRHLVLAEARGTMLKLRP